jgi:hypothetical protein
MTTENFTNEWIDSLDFLNYYQSADKQEKQNFIGLDATYQIGSDSYGVEIKEIKRNGRTIITTRGSEFTAKKTSNYDWRTGETTESIKYTLKGSGGGILSLGKKVDKLDPHF